MAKIASEVVSTYRFAQGQLSVSELQRLLATRDVDGLERLYTMPMANADAELRDAFIDFYMDLLEQGGNAAARTVKRQLRKGLRVAKRTTIPATFTTGFDREHAAAGYWASRESATLITDISVETRNAIRAVITEMMNSGVTAEQAAKILQPMLGLTERDSMAVWNLRQRMIASPGKRIFAGKVPVRIPKSGATAMQLETVSARYSKRLLRNRASNIARTESLKAANEGQRQMWMQAQETGDLKRTAQRELIITPDERLCPVCAPMAGERTTVSGTFSKGEPPFHSRCRCTTGLVFES